MSRSLKKLVILIPAIILVAAACNKQAAVQPAPAPQANPAPVNDVTADWRTITTKSYTYKYPAKLSTEYMFTQVWPPSFKLTLGTFSCKPTGAGVTTIRKTTTSPAFCVKDQSDGTAGTIYHIYSYTATFDGKLLTFDFTLGYPDCGVYDEPKKTACDQEEAKFDLDGLISQIYTTFKVTDSAGTENWKTYTNAQYGFEFKYPLEFRVEDSSNSGIPATDVLLYIVKGLQKNDFSDLRFLVMEDSGTKNLNQAFELYFTKVDNSKLFIGQINNLQTISGIFTLDTGTYKGIVITDGKLFVGFQANEVSNENEKILDQILSTFKFTK